MTPGWNDPPILSHNIKSAGNKTSRLSNKRVAFPMSNTTNAISNNPQNYSHSSQIQGMTNPISQSQSITCNLPQNFNEYPKMSN